MKKRLIYLLILSLLLFMYTTCGSGSAKKERTPVAWDTLEELLASMTLAEKVGQMTQAERGDIQKGDIEKYALGQF